MARLPRFLLILAVSSSLSGCVEHIRVPLPSPLSTVGGARPPVYQGFQLISEFGDGVWGQEQERAEMIGGGLGLAMGGRVELQFLAFSPTKKVVSDETGRSHSGASANQFKGKVLVEKFEAQRLNLGVHLAVSGASREAGGAQDESLRSVDLAVPVEFDWIRSPEGTRNSSVKDLSVFAGPRIIHQSLDDKQTGESESGTLWGINFGLRSRLSYIGLIGELNFAWTPGMTLGGIRSERDFIVLPMAGVQVLIPFG